MNYESPPVLYLRAIVAAWDNGTYGFVTAANALLLRLPDSDLVRMNVANRERK